MIETLLAITLLAMIAIPTVNLFLQGHKFINRSRLETVAIALAQEKVEEIKALAFDDLRQIAGGDIQERVVLKEGVFIRTTIPEREDYDLIKITVELAWEGRRMTLVTYRSRY